MNKTFTTHTRHTQFLLSISERQTRALFAIQHRERNPTDERFIRASGRSLIKKGLAVIRGDKSLVEALRITEAGRTVCVLLRQAGFRAVRHSNVVPIRRVAA